jgi:hypothetical protein
MKNFLFAARHCLAVGLAMLLLAASPTRAATALYTQAAQGSGYATENLLPPRSTFTINASEIAIKAKVTDPSGPSWFLMFYPPLGQTFHNGIYEGAGSQSLTNASAPGMSITEYIGCSIVSGRFEISQLKADSHGTILSFALQFEYHCNDQGPGPPVFGQLLYYATGGRKPFFSVAVAQMLKGNDGISDGDITVSLSQPLPVPTSVAFETADETAVAGTDYTASQGTLTFPAGTTSETLAIPILGNRVVRGNRTFTLTLSDPTGVPIGYGKAQAHIIDPNGPVTALLMSSGPDDWIGLGYPWSVVSENKDAFEAYLRAGILAAGTSNDGAWDTTFAAPSGSDLTPGTYLNVQRYLGGQAATPTMDVGGQSRGCNQLTGWFTVNALQSVPKPKTLSIDFQQTCEGDVTPLSGSVRENSPVQQLSLTNAVITGNVATFEITVNPASSVTVGGTFLTGDGTAVAGTDYAQTDVPFQIPAGQTSTTVNVPLLRAPQHGLYFYGGLFWTALPPPWNWIALAHL